MESRERVLNTVRGERPDRVPCDFHASQVVVDKLCARLKVSSFRGLMEGLGTDMVDIRGMVDPEWTGPVPKFIRLSDGVTQDWLGHRRKIQSTVFGDVPEHCGYIWRDAGSVEEIKTIDVFKFPEPSWFDFSPMRAGLKQYSGYAVMASGASVFQHPTLIRGLDTFLCDLYSEPEIAQFIISRYTDFYLAYFDLMFSTLPGMIDILRIADDFGMQDRPLLSPELFRLYFKHRIAALCAMAHSHGVFVMFHSCGAVRDFIPDLIDAGVDILDPLQPRAAGMELSALKRDFGGQICFHGSIDTQETLPRGTPHDVADEARDRLSLFDKEAGFIIAPAHSVQPDVPVENIEALYAAVRNFSR